MKNKIVPAMALILVVFLLGFVPQYARVRGLESELQQVRRENALAGLRNLAGLVYIQASQKNYGLAAGTGTRFFTRVREVANQSTTPGEKSALESVLGYRDKITAGLAKGDAAVMGDLQEAFEKTRKVTSNSTGI